MREGRRQRTRGERGVGIDDAGPGPPALEVVLADAEDAGQQLPRRALQRRVGARAAALDRLTAARKGEAARAVHVDGGAVRVEARAPPAAAAAGEEAAQQRRPRELEPMQVGVRGVLGVLGRQPRAHAAGRGFRVVGFENSFPAELVARSWRRSVGIESWRAVDGEDKSVRRALGRAGRMLRDAVRGVTPAVGL